MERKLYVSDEAIEKMGKGYFKKIDVDNLAHQADDGFVKLEDDLLLSRDDMYDLYISVSEEDVCFNDVEDL